MYRPFVKRSRNLRLPLLGSAKLKIAQISHSTPFDGAELFSTERWPDLQAYSPNVLVGSAADLQRLMQRFDLRTLELTTVDYAVFVLTELGDKPLTDTLRVVLWQRLGVPVYELYLDGTGTLLASECEAQQGWHIQPGIWFLVEGGELVLHSHRGFGVRTGLPFSVKTQACRCGRPGPRIVPHQTVVNPEESGAEPLLAAIA